MAIPDAVRRRNPNYQPSPPINRIFSGPIDANGLPLIYDPNFPIYNNLTQAQLQWFYAQPEWQNFKAWAKLNPDAIPTGNPIDAPDMTTMMAALTAANVTAMPLGVVTPTTPATLTGIRTKSPFDSSPV